MCPERISPSSDQTVGEEPVALPQADPPEVVASLAEVPQEAAPVVERVKVLVQVA